MARLVVGHVQENEFLEVAVGVKHLNAPVAAISHVDVVGAIDPDVVRVAEVAGVLIGVFSALARRAPALEPVSVLVELGDLRIEVAVADVDVIVPVPGDVGGAVEVAVHRRRRRIGVPVARLVRAFIAPPEVHYHHSLGIKLHYGHRSFVHHPQVAVLVEAHRVCIGQAVDAAPDFAYEVALLVELHYLRGGLAVDWTTAGAAGVVQHHDVPFGIDCHSQDFAQIAVGRQLQERHRLKRNFRGVLNARRGRRFLCKCRGREKPEQYRQCRN